MDIFNLTNNRLIEMGFHSMQSVEIENLGGVIYKSPINYVVLKKAFTHEELNNLNSYSTKIRRIMLDSKVNINNTYLIFCTSINMDYETFFMIERDTRALRKYVIRNEKDLNRIPFLDNLQDNDGNKSDLESNFGAADNVYLQKILNYIKENSGQQNKLNKQQIDYSIDFIMEFVGEDIED